MLPDALRRKLADDLAGVDAALRGSLASNVALIRTIAEYIVSGGGKRIRPALLLLASRACGYEGRDHHGLAAVMEMIHTATLLHDDVVDESALRRGHATANAAFGNAASVLVGDFLYSRAFQMMVGAGSMRVLEIVSEATNVIAEGEVLQLMHAGDPDLGEDGYRDVIRRKTAKLFEASAQIGAVLAAAPPDTEHALARYGMHLGTAFQLVDDVLDYSGDAGAIGKNPGDDLAEGKMTLPLIHALAVGNAADVATLRAAIERGRAEEFGTVVAVLERTGALAHARSCAEREADAAAASIAPLPESPHRQSLLELAAFAARRTS